MFILFDDWSASWNAILICLLEVVLVSWIYGIDKFFANIEEMGMKLDEAAKGYFKVCLCYIAPCLLSILLVTSFALSQTSEANVFGQMYIFEETGWCPSLGLAFGNFQHLFYPSLWCLDSLH